MTVIKKGRYDNLKKGTTIKKRYDYDEKRYDCDEKSTIMKKKKVQLLGTTTIKRTYNYEKKKGYSYGEKKYDNEGKKYDNENIIRQWKRYSYEKWLQL